MWMDLIENSKVEGLKEANNKVTNDAVVVVIHQGEEEEAEAEDASKEKYYDTSSSLLGSKSCPEVVFAFHKPLITTAGSRHTNDEELGHVYMTTSSSCGSGSGLNPQIKNTTFLDQQQPCRRLPEIENFSTSTSPAIDDRRQQQPVVLMTAESTGLAATSNNNNRIFSPTNSSTINKENIETGSPPISTPKTPLVEVQGLGEEDEEDEDIYTDRLSPCGTPFMASAGGQAKAGESEEDEDIYKIEKASKFSKRFGKKLKFWVLIEWIALISITWTLITSLTIDSMEHHKILDFYLWKWCVLLLVIVCGRLFTDLVMHGLAFLINRNFLLRKKLLYYVYELKRSVQVCIWLGLVLLSWVLLFHTKSKIMEYITRVLVSILAGTVIWLIKNTLIKTLAASVSVNSYFDRIQQSFFHQYVLQMLSGPPLRENKTPGQLSIRTVNKGKGGEGQEMINVAKLHKLKQEKISAWTMKLLSNVISNANLSTFSSSSEELDDGECEQKDTEITSELEAKAAALRIFRNVAKPGAKYISQDDLLRFLRKEEVINVFSLFEGAVETGKIKRLTLRNWVVKVFLERKSLAHSLNDSQSAVKQLNRVASVIVLVMIFISWILLMGIATTQLLLFISSQMILIVFVFGNTAKVVFEGIIFVFVIHPFDVGDRCVINEVEMVVEEMNILSTVFLRYDNQKMYYPNAELATKCIGNIYRSPFMGDSVEFSVDVSTTVESILALKARIKTYIESKPLYWNPIHSVVVLDVENMNKMNLALCVCHTMNHQDMGEKVNRRSDLVFELKKILSELGLRYRLQPQEVIVTYAAQQQQQQQHL